MKNYQFRLIDSTYEMEDAREILLHLITSKIQFIHHKILSLEERFGTDTQHLKTRVQELKAEKRSLELMLEEHEGEELSVDLACSVFITMKEPELAS